MQSCSRVAEILFQFNRDWCMNGYVGCFFFSSSFLLKLHAFNITLLYNHFRYFIMQLSLFLKIYFLFQEMMDYFHEHLGNLLKINKHLESRTNYDVSCFFFFANTVLYLFINFEAFFLSFSTLQLQST